MYHNTSSTQDSNMNLLTSPFDPNQLDYVLANELGYAPEQQQSVISQDPQTLSAFQQQELQQLHHMQQIQQIQQQQQMQQQQSDIWNASFMSQPQYSPTASVQPLPTQLNNTTNDLYNKSPSPQAPTQTENMNNTATGMSHDFASRSPESSSSTESNLVSPPQQYHPSNNDYSDLLNDSLSIPPPLVSKHHQHHARRSSSVPPHFHRFKQHQHQLMQVVDPSFPYHHFKQPPIQIKRVTNTPAHPNQPSSMDAEAYKTQLDEKLAKVNFDDITVAELKEMLRERGLSATGRKAELMQRLKEEQNVLLNNRSAVIKAPGSPALHRRVANISLTDSPTMERKRFSPYSTPPQRHSSISIAQMSNKDRMASSLPDAPSAFLNDQFMKRKPSTLRNSLDETEFTEPMDTPLFPTVEATTDDVWDEQMLQNFLNQI